TFGEQQGSLLLLRRYGGGVLRTRRSIAAPYLPLISPKDSLCALFQLCRHRGSAEFKFSCRSRGLSFQGALGPFDASGRPSRFFVCRKLAWPRRISGAPTAERTNNCVRRGGFDQDSDRLMYT